MGGGGGGGGGRERRGDPTNLDKSRAGPTVPQVVWFTLIFFSRLSLLFSFCPS